MFQYHCRRQRIEPATMKLRYNRHFLLTHTQAFMQEVIPHEVSHMAVYFHYGTKVQPHGQQWQRMMEQCFYLPARIYHDFPVQPTGTHARPYIYSCACTTHHFTARRHKNRLKGSQYQCQTCGDILNYIGKRTPTHPSSQEA